MSKYIPQEGDHVAITVRGTTVTGIVINASQAPISKANKVTIVRDDDPERIFIWVQLLTGGKVRKL